MDAIEIAILMARVWAGVVMLAHGIHHARSLEGTAGWFEKVGFRAAGLNARFSAAGELAIGAALIAGVLTSFAAAGLVAIMVVAFWSVHRFAGFFVFHRPDEGYEYVVTLAMLALVIAIVGPGPVSGDALLGIDDDLDGGLGGLIAALGLLAGALQLVMFWRSPSTDDSR